MHIYLRNVFINVVLEITQLYCNLEQSSGVLPITLYSVAYQFPTCRSITLNSVCSITSPYNMTICCIIADILMPVSYFV